MMTVKTGSSNWYAETGTRLDASYHLSEARQAKTLIDKSPLGSTTLREATENVFLGGRFTRVYVTDSTKGYAYLTASDMIKADPFSATYLSKAHTKNLSKLTIRKNWILLSCSGSIGRTVYTNDLFDGQVGTHDLIRIVPNTSVLPGGYLYAYLSSKYGFALLTQGTYGGVIQHIEPHHVADLPIPILPDTEQQAIHETIETVARLRVEANSLLGIAEAQFLDNLSLDSNTYRRLTSASERDTAAEFVVSSEALSARTIRARNYAKRLREIVAALTVGKHDALVDVLQREPYYTGRFKRIESSSATAVELFSQGDIFALKPQGQLISPRTVPTSGKVLTERGSILVAGVGTLGENEIFGRAKFVWGYLEGKLVAQHIIRFEPNESVIDPGYLFAVLNSRLWFRIFRSTVCGTNLLGFIVPMLNDMPVPRFDKSIEEAIGQSVKTAYEKMTEANQLETRAIARVEELVGSW